jgi:putative membrane protein
MKMLKYLYIFREFVLLSLLFMTIERIAADKQLANYINPDYHIFIHIALIILLVFTAFAMAIASSRDVNEKPAGTDKYIFFIILLILMNIPHDNTLFYEHLSDEREFNLQVNAPGKTGRKSISEISELSHEGIILPGETADGISFKSDLFEIKKDNFYSAAEDIFAYPEKYVSKKIEITGFVYKSDKLKNNRYIIARLVMWCCAADAGITGLIFDTEKTGGSFKKDEWLKLYGHIEMQNAGSSGKENKAPVLVVESFKKIPPESSPYVYPVN